VQASEEDDRHAAGDDEADAAQRERIGEGTEDEEAGQHRPHREQIIERRDGAGRGVAVGQEDEQVAEAEEQARAGKQQQVVRRGRHPILEQQGRDARAHHHQQQRRIGDNRRGNVGADLTADNVARRNAHRAHKSEQRVGRKPADARLRHQQRAGEPDRDQHHASNADLLAIDQRDAEQQQHRRDLAQRRKVGDRHVGERDDEAEHRAKFERVADHHPFVDHMAQLAAIAGEQNQRQHQQRRHHPAQEQHLIGRHPDRRELHQHVIGREHARGDHHEGDAAQIGAG